MPLLDLFWTLLYLFLLFTWVWLVITVYIDIFRSDDLSGWAKALWVVFVLFLPLLGVLIYLVSRGQAMAERHGAQALQAQDAQREYVRDAAHGISTADELQKLKDLSDQGVITEDEFIAQKAKLLG